MLIKERQKRFMVGVLLIILKLLRVRSVECNPQKDKPAATSSSAISAQLSQLSALWIRTVRFVGCVVRVLR